MTGPGKSVRDHVFLAIEHLTGKYGRLDENMFLKRDLGLTSIDLVDLFFEIEGLAGKKIDARALLLGTRENPDAGRDLRILDIISHLEALA